MAALQAARMFALLEAPLICTGCEEPAIKTRRLVVILLGDAQRPAVLVVVRGPPVRGHSVVEQLAAVGVWRSRRTCSTQAASARWGIHWSSCEIFVPKSAS